MIAEITRPVRRLDGPKGSTAARAARPATARRTGKEGLSIRCRRRLCARFLRAHLDTAPGPRTVPFRSMSARWGGLQKVSALVPGHALRTGTVRGPPGAVPRCARFLSAGDDFMVNTGD